MLSSTEATKNVERTGNLAEMGSVGRGDASRTASIYKNPFEVPKDQLIRQLFEFPARIAAFIQSQKSDGNGAIEVMESPFVVLAAKLKAKDEMEARNLVSGESQKSDGNGAIEVMESPCVLAAKLKARDEMEARNLVSGEMNCSIELCVEQQPIRDALSEGADWSRSTMQEKNECALEARKAPTSGVITYSRRKRKVVDQSGVSGGGRMARAEEVVAIFPALISSLNHHDVANFIIEVIRTLRHTRHGNTEKLFELLSIEHFPVDKCRFLEELIQQAYCYNKDAVAKQLTQIGHKAFDVDAGRTSSNVYYELYGYYVTSAVEGIKEDNRLKMRETPKISDDGEMISRCGLVRMVSEIQSVGH
ncbi:hypothetical protein GOP47_0011668 [Adiantum capillus-veneris]|uniref:Uncharacterized protein n=1 Tax=Adiantum capillus-veneris TaxID=13818 RepID=A0A9D4UTQ7_ADICA|nr:hypothetical protein GOP47_0011668 [Adiantum capillus-veneris]